jgi:hypothetical protein
MSNYESALNFLSKIQQEIKEGFNRGKEQDTCFDKETQANTHTANKSISNPKISHKLTKSMEIKQIEERLKTCIEKIELDSTKKQILLKEIYDLIAEIENDNRLSILYEYEKHYLELLQQHKDEIKFANSIQEDLRRERSQFFTYGLREVCETLKNSGVDDNIASAWIQELVKSYTKSLDVSSDLAANQVIDTIGELKSEAKNELKKVTQIKATDKTSDE